MNTQPVWPVWSNTTNTTNYAKTILTNLFRKIPSYFQKYWQKTVYIREHIKLFRFYMNPQKAFSLWITNSLCSIFIELWLQSKTIYSMQVWTLFGKVLERLRIHHESVKICISVNVVLCTFTLGHLSKRYKTFAIFFVENFFYIVCFFSELFSTIWCFFSCTYFSR